MNSNLKQLNNLKEFSQIIADIKEETEVTALLNEILTETEINALSKRWQILSMLAQGYTQRDIATELKVSLCKVTRGAKIIKSKNSVINKYLEKEKKQ